ncbi:hypothetical protein [Halobellus limi]|uniref:Uncharacterized protein n=1 Tax=Halobellus limi TaxID=699433 RepID=A0A1H5T045_9EURY|nr:hypothetical protein [Halobellus limi]QCC47442.1 hypothetical protein DV707_07075 [Halobellus limi]SEF56149.1 hypothetical protein SAMN04488133_0131 [Halobellus limi]
MGVLGDAYDTVAGAADHAAGSVDESIGRQFDDETGGGFFDVAPEGSGGAAVDTDGDGEPEEFNNRFLRGPVRTVYDATFDYEGTLNGEEDTVDLIGPTTGDVATGETGWQFKAVVVLVAVGAFLYLARPLLTILAGVTAEE